MSDRFLTVVIRNPTEEEVRDLVYHPKLSATSWGHAMNEVYELKWRIQKLLNEGGLR
jgi:hypothetical protein